jgi:predicted esterase
MPTANVPFDVTIGPPRQSELHPATHQNIPGGGDVPLRWVPALPGARRFEIAQRRLEQIMLRGDGFRSRTPHRYWLTLIILALLLVPGAQEIEGVPDTIPIACKVYFPFRKQEFFYGHEWNTSKCQDMVEKLNDLTGLLVSSFQGQELGTSSVVDDRRGRSLAQKERRAPGPPSRDQAQRQPKPTEDPLADVADIPSQVLQAGGDANKRYILIGPKKNTEPPAQGYGLLVIMPGGDGSADFHPFVKRIYKNALPDGYVAAQPIAVQWLPDQQIVWPTKTNPVVKMKFGTEEFVEAVIEDVGKKHKVDRTKVFSLSWSSSGPAAYATSLQNKRGVMGSFIAMSVFNPKFLPPLKDAKGHAYYLYHSQQDRNCPFRMAEQAKNSLAEHGAKVRLETYEGGHGWRGNVFHDIRNGIEWLEQNQEKVSSP